MIKKTIGGFHLENGLPDEYYAFTGGELSATIERNGGINTIGCLDIHEKDGRLYPDRKTIPIFQKESNSCGKRPLYGSAVKFISTATAGAGKQDWNIFHVPDIIELYPFGFKSESRRFGYRSTYDMAIIGRKILFSFSNDFPSRKDLIISINKDHIHRGEIPTFKDCIRSETDETGSGSGCSAAGLSETAFQKWDFVGYDSGLNAFVAEGKIEFGYADKDMTVLISSDTPMSFRETKNQYFLIIPWKDVDTVKLCLVAEEHKKEAAAETRKTLRDFDKLFTAAINKSVEYSSFSPTLRAEDFPEAEIFSKTAPSFLKAMVLAETENEACIRAATHKYGVFNLWDQVWPARAFILMGDWDTAKKLIRYPVTMFSGREPHYEYIFTALFIICIAEDITAVSGDYGFTEKLFSDLKRLFLAYAERTGENGLLASPGTCGIDDPAEIGIDRAIWASCLNGLWYDACMAMENMAFILKDEKTAQTAGKLAENIKASYLPTFYDEKNGYLYSSVKPDTQEGIKVFQNVSTLGMDFVYGESLIYPHIEEIAEFQARQLYHPAGRSSVPYWDNAHEMWKSCIMCQHLAHEMKTARHGGLGDEIKRMMNIYLSHFKKNKLMFETHNLAGANEDITQRSNWQAFAVRALYSGIFESLIGIECDLGGLTYCPCDLDGNMSVTAFRFRQGIWNIKIDGKGPFAEPLLINGQAIPGTMKIPAEYFTDAITRTVQIKRSRTPFACPTLLAAAGAAICDLASEERELSFSVTTKVHTVCKIYCPTKPTIKLNAVTLDYDWNQERKTARLDTILEPGRKLLVTV
ncbi:MAG: hypothetical protein WCS27_18355 [Victivallaceae bacterium]